MMQGCCVSGAAADMLPKMPRYEPAQQIQCVLPALRCR